ncbi:DUF4468 domain-containing protein [Solirubrum puertoriconensis]|uniref:DUF4468 domain-containing protein n=1 Tax=Solirubrum puertoriconensis TaxID=1751427 RepID=A0A9X0HN42_SOLP1|nr:DUF4468 domain-containing protein [Solirubrum puertoriconensis]KUG09031.1 hypothetical protein ASU33_19600 [Solirubrum puertoriconensis]
MKNPFLLLTLLGLLTAPVLRAQQPTGKEHAAALPVSSASKLITYTSVVEVPGASRDELFTRASQWVSTAYKSSVSAPQTIDKEGGKIIIQGFTPAKLKALGINSTAGNVTHTLSLYVKDGRYKYEFTNFYHEGIALPQGGVSTGGALENAKPACGPMMMLGFHWRSIKEHTDEQVRELISQLTTTMASKAKDPTDF